MCPPGPVPDGAAIGAVLVAVATPPPAAAPASSPASAAFALARPLEQVRRNATLVLGDDTGVGDARRNRRRFLRGCRFRRLGGLGGRVIRAFTTGQPQRFAPLGAALQ